MLSVTPIRVSRLHVRQVAHVHCARRKVLSLGCAAQGPLTRPQQLYRIGPGTTCGRHQLKRALPAEEFTGDYEVRSFPMCGPQNQGACKLNINPCKIFHGCIFQAFQGPSRHLESRLSARQWQHWISLGLQYLQVAASLLFVVLYVWSTYSAPVQHSPRAMLDLLLCVIFAGEYLHRLLVRKNSGPG